MISNIALKLLWNFEAESRRKSPNAGVKKIALRFRDEYQDINAAQEQNHFRRFPAMARCESLSCRRREAEHLSLSAGGSENSSEITLKTAWQKQPDDFLWRRIFAAANRFELRQFTFRAVMREEVAA